MNNIIIIIGILIGLFQCFFGYPMFKTILGLIGFFIGSFTIGSIIFAMTGNIIIVVLSGLAGGIIGTILMPELFVIGVFITGALLGSLVGVIFLGSVNNSLSPLLLIFFIITGGVLALIFKKLMIIISTSFVGAWSIVAGITYFIAEGFDPMCYPNFIRSGGILYSITTLCWIILGICGIVVQYKYIPKYIDN